MAEKTLILEGLPADLDSVRPRLQLHFKNKRKSGGEIIEIRNYPDDNRKALLVYLEDEAHGVLEKGTHKVDFKSLGVIDLQVKPQDQAGVANMKREQTRSEKPAPDIGEAAPVSFHQEGLPEDVGGVKLQSLLVSSACPIEEELVRMYFEQFSEKADIRRHGGNLWILQLADQSDLENVLAKTEHRLAGSVLSVRLHDEIGAGAFDPHRFTLSGFSGDCKSSLLSVYIGSCSRGAEHSWEVLNDGERIAVTFKQNIDIEGFLKKCSSKKLQNMVITAHRLEYTDSVLVQGDLGSISEDILCLYFSNKRSNGGKVKSLNWVNRAKSVIVTFEDFHAALRVANQKHTLCEVSLCALLFYSSLQQALVGEKLVLPTSPIQIFIPVDALFLEYVQNNEECREDFERTLQEVHTSISFEAASETQVVLEMAVDSESVSMHRLAPTWERKVRQAVETLLEKYNVAVLMATKDVWERVKSKCFGLSDKDASVSFESAKNTIMVVGQQNGVKRLHGEIELLVHRAKGELEIETNTVEKKIPLDSKEKLDFVWNLVSAKLEGVERSKDDVNLTFHLKGLRDKVNTAEQVIKDTTTILVTQTLNLSPRLATFLKSLDLKKFERNHFAHISATILNCGDSDVQILAEKEDEMKAIDKIKEVLKEEVINLTPDQGKITQGKQWGDFFSGLMQEVESSGNVRNVGVSQSDMQILVCGFWNVVADITRKLKGHLSNKMLTTKDVPLNSLRQAEYVDACMNLSEAPEVKALDVTILVSRTQASPCLRVTASSDKIEEALVAVKEKVSHIVNEKHTYSNAGESKVLDKHQVGLKASVKDFGCKLYLTIEQANQTSSHLSYSYKIADCLTLTVAPGNLYQQMAEVIVCPLGGNLLFDNPIAQQILQVGGPKIKCACDNLLKKNQASLAGDVVETNTGNLSAKALFYAVIPTWGQSSLSVSGESLELIYLASAVQKSLQCTENNNYVSMAMPALGCGTFGFPVRDSCKVIGMEIIKFGLQGKPTNLRNILIVDPDTKTVEEFHAVLKEMECAGTLSRATQLPANQECSTELIIGSIKVKALCGDLTTETTDAIVSSTNTSLDLNSGVSGAILKAAGQSVVDECKALGTQASDGVVITKAGNLQTGHIVHMVGQAERKGITSSMRRVLETCDGIRARSVSFPALGTGAGKLSASEMAGAMIDAVHAFARDKPKSSVATIHIVVFQPKMMFDFEQVMKDFQKVTRTHGSAASAAAGRKPHPTSPNSSLASATDSVTFPVMVVEVYGVSAASLARAKRCLDDQVAEECASEDVAAENLHLLSEADGRAIAAASRRDQVRVQVLGNKMTVSGKRDDVLALVLQIKDSLQRAKERESREREERRIWKTVHWEVETSNAWRALDRSINCNLELAYHNKDTVCTYQHSGDSFTVDLKKLHQTDSKGNTIKIKRTLLTDSETAIIAPPPAWTKLDGKDLDVIALCPKSKEFRKISKDFVQSCQEFVQETGKNIEVVQIQRIQHQDQWRRYAVSKQAVDKKYPRQNNEQFLYHGTTKDICQKINEGGFNRSFCGRNATLYGSGTYFAKEAYYSCSDIYSNPDQDGLKYMYRARVLTGKPCLGREGMKEPSPVNPGNHQADCAVNNLQMPFIFVIFCDSGAYPDYLITFKTV